MSEDEFDNFPDLFAGVSEAEWSRILDRPDLTSGDSNGQHPQQQGQGGFPASPTGSTDYGDDDSMDAETLAELDRIEVHALQTLEGSSPTTRGTGLSSMWLV